MFAGPGWRCHHVMVWIIHPQETKVPLDESVEDFGGPMLGFGTVAVGASDGRSRISDH